MLAVGERDDALAVFVLSPTVGEWHCAARCWRCLSTPTIVVVRSLLFSRTLPSVLLLPVLVPAVHLCCGLFSLSLPPSFLSRFSDAQAPVHRHLCAPPSLVCCLVLGVVLLLHICCLLYGYLCPSSSFPIVVCHQPALTRFP